MSKINPYAMLLYFLPYILVALTIIGWWLGGYWTFITPVFVYGVINLSDHIFPQHPTISGVSQSKLERQEGPLSLYSFPPILWSFTQLCFIGWCIWVVTFGNLSTLEIIGVVLSVGVMAGAIGITFSHELIHRKHLWERLAGEIMLLSVTYHHWSVEHVYGHHRTVGTPDDPATARLGESFYAFMPRTVFGGLISSIKLESSRLRRRKRKAFSFYNRVISGLALEIAFYLIISFSLGWEAALTWFAVSFIAIFQLEVVNYFEHYGLCRREITPGRFEPVSAKHSWDDGHRISGYFLANLQRHSDHHLRPGVRYDSLKLVNGAPRLPAGYASMLLMALIPPLWFSVMNPRIK